MNISINARGILLAGSGIITLSPDSLLIRLIDTDLWTLTFLRSIFLALTLFLFNLALYRSKVMHQFFRMDRYAVIIACCMALSNLMFVASVQNTSVAHALIIVGAVPAVAALFALIFIHEKVPKQTWVTIVVVLICLVFVVYDGKQSSIVGDLFALLACLIWSAIFVLARKTQTSMITAMCLSGIINAFWTLPVAELDGLATNQWWLGCLLGTLVGVALSQITLAPRFIPAAEVAVFMPLETVIGSLLVWWFLGEFPGVISMVAGSIMILAIMLNSYFQIKYSTS